MIFENRFLCVIAIFHLAFDHNNLNKNSCFCRNVSWSMQRHFYQNSKHLSESNSQPGNQGDADLRLSDSCVQVFILVCTNMI
jgi:hypothetical protein